MYPLHRTSAKLIPMNHGHVELAIEQKSYSFLHLHLDYGYNIIWSCAEPSIGVISACIPSLRPLVSLITRGTTRAAGASSSGGGGKGSAHDQSNSGIKTWRSRVADEDKDGSFARLDDPADDNHHAGSQWETSAQGGKVVEAKGGEDEISLEEISRPDGRIRVKNEVTVSYGDWRLDYKGKVF